MPLDIHRDDRTDGSGVRPSLEIVTASDGYELACHLWLPSHPPRGLIVALHGIQSHAGWYNYSSRRLSEAGYAVAFLDRRGSGVSEVARGDAPHAERLVADVVQVTRHFERLGFRHCPKMLIAISWGGKLAAAVAAQQPDLFDGLALLTPGLHPRIRATAAQTAALRLASNAGLDWKLIPIPLDDPALFTDVPEYRVFIRDDPYTLRHVTVRFLRASAMLDQLVAATSTSIRCPLLLMLAGRDQIIDNAATRQYVAAFGSTAKTLLDYPAACHTLEFEPNRDEIIDDLVVWLDTVRERTIRSHMKPGRTRPCFDSRSSS